MSSPLERILELENQGFVMSRNRHFEIFKDRANRAALDVWRNVAAIRRSLTHHRSLGRVSLELEAIADSEHYRLVVDVEDIAARLEWRLRAGEIGLLLRDPEVRAWFEKSGLRLPMESSRYMSGLSGAPS